MINPLYPRESLETYFGKHTAHFPAETSCKMKTNDKKICQHGSVNMSQSSKKLALQKFGFYMLNKNLNIFEKLLQGSFLACFRKDTKLILGFE